MFMANYSVIDKLCQLLQCKQHFHTIKIPIWPTLLFVMFCNSFIAYLEQRSRKSLSVYSVILCLGNEHVRYIHASQTLFILRFSDPAVKINQARLKLIYGF